MRLKPKTPMDHHNAEQPDAVLADLEAKHGSSPTPCSAWYPLFEHMSKTHGLTLLDDELNTIAFVADESRLKTSGGVAWILVNALRHLTCDELHALGEEISKRSGGTYTQNAALSDLRGKEKGTDS